MMRKRQIAHLAIMLMTNTPNGSAAQWSDESKWRQTRRATYPTGEKSSTLIPQTPKQRCYASTIKYSAEMDESFSIVYLAKK